MRFPSLLISLIAVLSLLACHKAKDTVVNTDCEALNTALIDRDLEVIKAQVNPLALDLPPQPASGDELGHAQNLETLVDRLNDQCDDYTASVLCYACIETLPLQSEILIELDSAGMPIERILDLTTPEDAPLAVINIHHE